MATKVLNKASTVSVVADRLTVFNNNGINGTHQLCCRGQLVKVLTNACFAGHRYVVANRTHFGQALNDIGKLIGRHIKCRVNRIHAHLLERIAVHYWRHRMLNGRAYKANEFSCAGDVDVDSHDNILSGEKVVGFVQRPPPSEQAND